jgi:ABC-type lipoprotein release transport system permease subunit
MIGALALLAPLAWRNLWRNPRRTLITLIVVAVGLYSILVFAALLDAWAQSSRESSLNLLTGSGQIHAAGYLDDPTVTHRMPPPDATLKTALNAPEISTWVARVRVPVVVQSEYKTLPLTLVGVDPAGEKRISTIPDVIADGHYLAGSDDAGIVLGRHLAERLKTRVGKRVIIMAQAADGTLAQQAYNVVGLFAGNQNAEDQFAFAGIDTSQKMLGIGSDISEISFAVPHEQALAGVIASLRRAAPGLDVSTWAELSPLTVAVNSFMEAFVYIWLWVMFVFMAIGIVNTQLMAVFERVREFGLLQALGMRPRLILVQVTLESAMLIGVGVVAGFVASVVTIVPLRGGINLSFLARGAEYFGAGHVLYPELAPGQFAELSIIVWLLGIVVALWPAQRAARANPVEAMSHLS